MDVNSGRPLTDTVCRDFEDVTPEGADCQTVIYGFMGDDYPLWVGNYRCLECGHTFTAGAPVGPGDRQEFLQCPACLESRA